MATILYCLDHIVLVVVVANVGLVQHAVIITVNLIIGANNYDTSYHILGAVIES